MIIRHYYNCLGISDQFYFVLFTLTYLALYITQQITILYITNLDSSAILFTRSYIFIRETVQLLSEILSLFN